MDILIIATREAKTPAAKVNTPEATPGEFHLALTGAIREEYRAERLLESEPVSCNGGAGGYPESRSNEDSLVQKLI